MIRHLEVWRRHLRLWLPAALFVLLNLASLSAYRFIYAGRAQTVEARLARARTELDRLVSRRTDLTDRLVRAERAKQQTSELYERQLASESQRLTRTIAEVKSLAERAGLEPTAISYPEQNLESYGLLKRSIVFGVDGTYNQLRQFVNLLELSDSFLTLDEVGLAEQNSGGTRLRIDLHISTLFAGDQQGGAATTPSRPREGR